MEKLWRKKCKIIMYYVQKPIMRHSVLRGLAIRPDHGIYLVTIGYLPFEFVSTMSKMGDRRHFSRQERQRIEIELSIGTLVRVQVDRRRAFGTIIDADFDDETFTVRYYHEFDYTQLTINVGVWPLLIANVDLLPKVLEHYNPETVSSLML